ncbi:hypothetical protein K0U83_17515 [bacterium]|nr:hypothetical protein [bacterium]
MTPREKCQVMATAYNQLLPPNVPHVQPELVGSSWQVTALDKLLVSVDADGFMVVHAKLADLVALSLEARAA